MSPAFYLFFLSFTFFIFNGATDLHLIKETCKKSAKGDPNISYEFCLTSLQANPKSQTTNLKGLGVIATKLTKTNATHTHSSIKKLLRNKQSNKYDKSCLKDCLELYSDSISTLKDAMMDVKSKRYPSANIKVSSAMDAATTCEDCFGEKGLKSPLIKNNSDMFQLCAIALSVINMLS